MPIDIKTPGIHHIAISASDFQRSREFYVDILGFKVTKESENFCMVAAGGTLIDIRGPRLDAESRPYPPVPPRLDHLALACEDEAELERVTEALSNAGVYNTGILFDEMLGKNYIGFKDPDDIGWELYMV